jgi:hypothetical protein
MTIRSRGGLTFDELRQLEADLLAHGYQPADDGAWEVRRYEYTTNREQDRDRRRLVAEVQGYSICWRN